MGMLLSGLNGAAGMPDRSDHGQAPTPAGRSWGKGIGVFKRQDRLGSGSMTVSGWLMKGARVQTVERFEIPERRVMSVRSRRTETALTARHVAQ